MTSRRFTARHLHEPSKPAPPPSTVAPHPVVVLVSRLVDRIDRHLQYWTMRHPIALGARAPRSTIRWTRSRHDTWVATTSSNQFRGMVEEIDGSYVANDTVGGTYNTYRTLAEAMQAFEPRRNPAMTRIRAAFRSAK